MTRAEALREAAKHARFLHLSVLAISGGDNGSRCGALCDKLDEFAAQAEQEPDLDEVARQNELARLRDDLREIYEVLKTYRGYKRSTWPLGPIVESLAKDWKFLHDEQMASDAADKESEAADAKFAEFQATHTAEEIDAELIAEGIDAALVRDTAKRFSRFLPMLFETRRRMHDAERKRDEVCVAMEAMREMTPEREAAACARLVEQGLLTAEQVLDVEHRVQAAALLMREIVIEKLWRERAAWNAEHPARSLGLRTLEPSLVVPHAPASLLRKSSGELRALASQVLTTSLMASSGANGSVAELVCATCNDVITLGDRNSRGMDLTKDGLRCGNCNGY